MASSLASSLARAAFAAGVGCVMAVASSAAPRLDGTVATVYVYNGGADNEGAKGDIFKSGAEGWILAAMGLLGADGKPPTENGDDLKQGDTVVGKVLRDADGKKIGYESSDGKTRAYNVDTSATTADAWGALDAAGTFVVAKHGIDGGGGIHLDDGELYPGFRESGESGGTGVNTGHSPYPLPAKNGGTVTFRINGCHTSQDPDGRGSKKSVTDSAGAIGGVGSTEGNDGIIDKGPAIGLGGDPRARAAAEAKLEAAAKAAGFTDGSDPPMGDWGSWIASLPFKDQYSTMESTIAGTDATFTIQYEKDTRCGPGQGEGCYYLPAHNVDGEAALLVYSIGPGYPSIALTIPAGALDGPTSVFLHPTPALLPPGLMPASYFSTVERYGLDDTIDFLQPALMTLGFRPGTPIEGVFEMLPDGSVFPIVPLLVDEAAGLAQIVVDHAGTFVAARLAPAAVPLPPWVPTVLALGVLVVGAAVLAHRSAGAV